LHFDCKNSGFLRNDPDNTNGRHNGVATGLEKYAVLYSSKLMAKSGNNSLSYIIDYMRRENVAVIKCDSIIFEEHKYPYRTLKLENETVSISTRSLEKQLLNEDGEYISDNAIIIDEMVYFYVEDNEIYLQEDRLSEIIGGAV
jgi:hypothetical protein